MARGTLYPWIERKILNHSNCNRPCGVVNSFLPCCRDSITAGTGDSSLDEALLLIKKRVDVAKDMFGGLQSFYLQRKYFRENFQLVVSKIDIE